MHSLKDFIDARLIAQTRALGRLTASIRSVVTPGIAQSCWASGIKGETLCMITTNSAAATHLRYQQHEILKHVNCELRAELDRPLLKLKIRLTHFREKHPPAPVRTPPLPVQAARQIEAVADDISDPGLKAALRRLARRSRLR